MPNAARGNEPILSGYDGVQERDVSVNRLIRYLLTTSVLTSATLLALGLLIALVRNTPRPLIVPSLAEIVRPESIGNGLGLLYLGLMVLMITPVLEVAGLVYVYARIGRWRFVLISLLVLSLLGASLVLGGNS